MLTYKKNLANGRQIREHLAQCNFEPPLQTYLDVDAYIEKILKNAVRFECWDDTRLVGFAAVYCNDYTNNRSFITLVSVDAAYGRQGIAKTLISTAEDYCRADRFRTIALEVYENNTPAISLYEKRGFVIEGKSEHTITMTKDLSRNDG